MEKVRGQKAFLCISDVLPKAWLSQKVLKSACHVVQSTLG